MNQFKGVFPFLLLLFVCLPIGQVTGDDLCDLCECSKGRNKSKLDLITCKTTNRKLFEDEVEWPKLQRIEVIEFKDISAVLPM